MAISPLPGDAVFAFYYGAASAESEKKSARILKYGLAAASLALEADPEPRDKADIYELEGVFYEELGKFDEATASASKSADVWLSIVNALGGLDAESLSSFRGDAGSLTGNLADAERFDEAEEWHKVFVAAYPNEVTYHYKYAKFLSSRERMEEAQVAAQLALDAAAGDSRLWAARRRGQMMTANDQEDEAIALLERVISETTLPQDPSLRTHRYVQRLQDDLDALKEGSDS